MVEHTTENRGVAGSIPALAILLAFALAIVLAGCGGGKKPVSPLDDTLGYFPKDAPLVATVQTDPDGPQLRQLRSLVGRFPGSDVLLVRLQNLTRLRSADFGRDIRPQLGGPLVVGLEKPAARKDLGAAAVVAMRLKHPAKAKQVLLRQPGFRIRGKAGGARVYENAGANRYMAVDGQVLVAAGDRNTLAHALQLKRSDNRLSEDGFNADLANLPGGGLARLSADPRVLIGADRRLRPLLGVRWISAFRRLGAVVKTASTGVTLDFRLATDRGSLRDKDLPLDPKPGALPLIGKPSEIQIATRQPERLARLGLAVWHALSPLKSAAFDAAQPRGMDLERQLPHHLAEPATLAIDPVTRSFAFRTRLNESGDVRNALTVLVPNLPDLATFLGIKGVGVGRPTSGENFYALAKPNGGLVVFGVVGDSLVAASDPQRAAGLASQPTHMVPGAKGAVIVTIDARHLVGNLLAKQLHGLPGLLAPFIASSLRDLTGTLTIDRSALRGHFKLTIVK